jgi:hypothetical protein
VPIRVALIQVAGDVTVHRTLKIDDLYIAAKKFLLQEFAKATEVEK